MKDIKKNKDIEIVGAGGKSGSRPPKKLLIHYNPRSTIRLVEVLSEGEIKGVVNGLKGVYFDDTPVQILTIVITSLLYYLNQEMVQIHKIICLDLHLLNQHLV